jgi:F420-0:gamma-glutamyl ligase-like protein
MTLAQRTFLVGISSVWCVLGLWCAPSFAAGVDLSNAVVVVRPGQLPNAEKTAATVLVEELEKRTGIHLVTSTS